MTTHESLSESLRQTREFLEWVDKALATLQEIAHETVPDDASPQLVYIVRMAKLAVEKLP